MTVDDLAVGAEATETRLRIDLWSDLGCPWCYVGKHRIQTAIETAGLEADIVLRSFELDPRAAAKPVPVAEMFASKFGAPPGTSRRWRAGSGSWRRRKACRSAPSGGTATPSPCAGCSNWRSATDRIDEARQSGAQPCL